MARRMMALCLSVCVMAVMVSGCRESNVGDYQISEDKKLILYTSHKTDVYIPLVEEFEERTGIWVQVRAGGTTELMDAIAAEEGSGICDVMLGGGVETYQAYSSCFAPYRCSEWEKLDQRYLSPDYLWTVFSELPAVFIYNNKLVSEEDAPKSWEEFLTDRWKGQIAFADAEKSGTSYTILATMIQALDMEVETVLYQFAEALDGNVSAGSREVVDDVSSGRRLVGLTLEDNARKWIREGADISMVYPEEGTSAVQDGCALVKGAPHEKNAKLFIDFMVSEDVQQLIAEQFCRRPVRQDIPLKEPLPEVKLSPFDLSWAGVHQNEILNLWLEMTENSL